MSNNLGKWKSFADGLVLFGPPGTGQNLNQDLQKAIADEMDAVHADLIGAAAATAGWGVTPDTGLAVSVAAGTGYAGGQRVKTAGVSLVSGLPPSTSGIKIFVKAGSAFSASIQAWPAIFGQTTGALQAGEMLLATVSTDGGSVTSVTDGRAIIGTLLSVPTADQKAALVGTASTPGAANKYVTDQDGRLPASGEKAALAGTAGTPGAANKYVTDQDARNANARAPTAHAAAHAAAGTDPIPHGSLASLSADDHPQYHKTGEVRRAFFESFHPDPVAPPEQKLIGLVPVLEFAPDKDQAVYAVLPIPPDLNAAQAASVVLRVAMSTGQAATIRLEGAFSVHKDGEDISVAGTPFGTTHTPNALANLRSSHSVATIAAGTLENAPDTIGLKLMRKGTDAVADTHGGAMRLLTVELEYSSRRGA